MTWLILLIFTVQFFLSFRVNKHVIRHHYYLRLHHPKIWGGLFFFFFCSLSFKRTQALLFCNIIPQKSVGPHRRQVPMAGTWPPSWIERGTGSFVNGLLRVLVHDDFCAHIYSIATGYKFNVGCCPMVLARGILSFDIFSWSLLRFNFFFFQGVPIDHRLGKRAL